VPREGSQSLVRLVLPGLPRTDPDWETAQVLNELLAGSSLGRLSRKVRTEAGLTYGIRSTLSEPTRGRGDWTCTLRTRHRSVPYALRLILAELQRLRNEPVPPAELEATIDGLVQAYPSFWSSASNRVETFATHAQAGWPADLQVRARERFRAVTPERLQAMARRLLDPSRLVVLVAGRLEEAEAGDPKDHPGTLREAMNLPVIPLTPSLSR
jgi:zinc protease